MNTVLVGLGITIFCNIASVAYFYGKTIGRIDAHSESIRSLSDGMIKAGEMLHQLSVDVAVLKGP